MRKSLAVFILAFVAGAALVSMDAIGQGGPGMMGPGPGMMGGGTGWGTGVFRSNGERIYFTATSERGTPITYTGGPVSAGWMMMGGRMACVSCHGPDGLGGKHVMMGTMQVMEAKDIRWKVLQAEFDAEKFRMAVTKGQDHDGSQMTPDMPRWNIGKEDLADLMAFLKTLP